MGIGSSIPVSSLPFERTQVQDGASGLHYSGRVYTNQFNQLSTDVCNGASASVDQIGDIMPNSISTTRLAMDQSTKRASIASLQGHVQSLVSSGAIPGLVSSNTNIDDQLVADNAFYAAVQAEYCFYEARYKAALTQFLTLAADARGANTNSVSTALQATTDLNKRLNSLLEIINYIGNTRAMAVNKRGPLIDKANSSLQEKIGVLRNQQEALTTREGRQRTQEEMVRYSAEKSRAMNIQISFFVALNVVALGTILTVYRSVRP
jgi:hypothetical protein